MFIERHLRDARSFASALSPRSRHRLSNEGRAAVTRLQKFALGALLAVALAVPLAGATAPPSGYWVEPAQTPNTDVVCSTCPCNGPGNCSNGMNTIGYPATLGRYVGRFLDSQHTNDYQGVFRTARAKYVYPNGNGRIYMVIGSAAFAYDAD